MNPTPEREALAAAEIGLANMVSYQSSGNSPSIDEFGQARRALAAVRAALSAPAHQVLPPLPKRENRPALSAVPYEVFTADQMRAYARAALQGATAPTKAEGASK